MQLIVIGGGAAGFFCAVNAARINPLLEVKIVEKSSKLLSKVRISGGGRCNVTHACFSIPEMAQKYPRGAIFVKKAFHSFFTGDTLDWFEARGVKLKAEEDGRMFPVSDSSETIIRCLLDEASKYMVSISMNREVKDIVRKDDRWLVLFADGQTETADFLCVASGGYPKAAMFEWIVRTGHSITDPVPSLFTFNMPGNPITELMGVAANVRVKVQGTRLEERGPVLITHWGLSGPAVLKLSARGARDLSDINYRFTVIVSWWPEGNEQLAKERFDDMRAVTGRQRIWGKNEFGLPQRLWERLCQISEIDRETRWADLTADNRNKLAKHLCAHEMKVDGKTTYKEEFVTAGGVKLSEIDHQSMQSRIVPGLYFAGEILDVDGVTGGFNFQHAWTSGWIAAKTIAAASMK